MLVLTTKKFEIEEPVKALNEEGETLYEFVMQLTSDEVQQIQELIFDKKSLELAQKKVSDEEKEQVEKELLERALENQVKFEDICFKEHKEPFKEKVGDYKYLEMVDMIFDFFWKAFIGKRVQRVNTMTLDLHKIGGN